MKVNIGPHKNWFGPYQLAEKLCFWAKKKKDEYGFPQTPDWVHDFGEFLAYGSIKKKNKREVGEIRFLEADEREITWLYKFLLWADKKRERKLDVHIDNYDTWDMGYTLAHIILPMLKQLKETKYGAPYTDDEDVPKHLRSTSAPAKENEYDTDDNYFKRWDWILDEMIFAFNTKAGDDQDWEDRFCSGESDLVFKKLENGYSELVRGPNHTRKYDHEGIRAYQNRINNGFRLFGKYYEALWD